MEGAERAAQSLALCARLAAEVAAEVEERRGLGPRGTRGVAPRRSAARAQQGGEHRRTAHGHVRASPWQTCPPRGAFADSEACAIAWNIFSHLLSNSNTQYRG